MEQLDSHSCN